MCRSREQTHRRRLLDYAARVHDKHAVHKARDHTEIMGDPDHRHGGSRLQGVNEVEDLLLNGHVEGRRRLVGNEQAWRSGNRHCDHHALDHAPGKLVGKGGLHAFGIDEADLPEHLASAFPGGRVARAVGPESLDNLGPNSQEGVQRGHRVLVDHRDSGTPNRFHPPFIELGENLVLETNLAAEDLQRPREEPEH